MAKRIFARILARLIMWISRTICRDGFVLVKIPESLKNVCVEITNDIKTQDNRMTASPYYFTIREFHRVSSSDDSDLFEWWDPTDCELRFDSKEEAKEHYLESGDDPDDLDNWLGMLKKWHYHLAPEHKGFFLTEKACHLHMKQNKHHYNDTVESFVGHVWRNPDMSDVYKLVNLIGESDDTD